MTHSKSISFFIKPLSSITAITLAGSAFGHESEAQKPFERIHAHESIEAHAHVGWESKYLSEGRDALDGDSLLTSSIELGWKHLSGGVWYGISPDQSYDELQLSLAVSQCVGDVEFYLGYTHLRFPFENAHDNELSTGATWTGLSADIELTADVTFSFEEDGYFAEIGAGKEFEINDKLTLSLSSSFGINQGYVSDGHDGANNVTLACGLEYALTDSLSLTSHGVYNWAIDKDSNAPGDDQLSDFFHGAVGLQYTF